MFAGRIVSTERVAEMVRPHSDAPSHEARYGLGFWLAASGDVVELHGYDAGVSFQTDHDPTTGLTSTVVSNTSEGAWPIVEHLDEPLRVVTVRSVAPVEREVTRVAAG